MLDENIQPKLLRFFSFGFGEPVSLGMDTWNASGEVGENAWDTIDSYEIEVSGGGLLFLFFLPSSGDDLPIVLETDAESSSPCLL